MTTTILKHGDHASVQGLALHDLAHPGRPPKPVANLADDAEAEEASTCEARHETRVEVVRLDGVVQAIEVHCGCGEVTVIELDPTPASAASNHHATPAPDTGAKSTSADHAAMPTSADPAATSDPDAQAPEATA